MASPEGLRTRLQLDATVILKAFCTLKSVAVAVEKKNRQEKVKEVENAVTDLLETYQDCMSLYKAIKSVGEKYEPGPENVHHEGQPLPGDEQEEIVLTNTQGNLLNITCPLNGKPIIALTAPVRSVQCQHIYEREAVLLYIRSGNGKAKCPISGVECDPLLLYEINLLCSVASKQLVE
ncbi:hypothetical protein MLD38_035171 [Melastoma candidum]|uniref:Uncharacterized protein n=1 Tax=Melastoma candidum TaxID=119954 RepID=A0ACB9MBZ9_9MYRT|nr:hypothetical protein MLD38_035171 [Melastoma candidum]